MLDNAMLVTMFYILIQVVLGLAAIGILVLLIVIVAGFSPFGHEKIMRSLAAVTGLLIYVGAKAIDISIPDMIFRALSTTMPFAVGLIGVIFACRCRVCYILVRCRLSEQPECIA